jgi:hypothetical protein
MAPNHEAGRLETVTPARKPLRPCSQSRNEQERLRDIKDAIAAIRQHLEQAGDQRLYPDQGGRSPFSIGKCFTFSVASPAPSSSAVAAIR